MQKLKEKTIQKIEKNGKQIGLVKTPVGIVHIWEVIESRGYQTNYLPKAFHYVELPNNIWAALTKYSVKHWENQGWEVVWF